MTEKQFKIPEKMFIKWSAEELAYYARIGQEDPYAIKAMLAAVLKQRYGLKIDTMNLSEKQTLLASKIAALLPDMEYDVL